MSEWRSDPNAFNEATGRLVQMVAPQVARAVHAVGPSPAARNTPVPADKPQPSARELRLVSTR